MSLRIVLRHQQHVAMTYEENARCCLVYIYLGPVCCLYKIIIIAYAYPHVLVI